MLNEIEKVRSSSEVQTKYLPRKQGKRIWPMSELAAISAHQIKRQLYCQLLYCCHIYVRFYHDSSSEKQSITNTCFLQNSSLVILKDHSSMNFFWFFFFFWKQHLQSSPFWSWLLNNEHMVSFHILVSIPWP